MGSDHTPTTRETRCRDDDLVRLAQNYNSGGEVSTETKKDARTAHVTLYQDAEHPSYLELQL